MFVSLLHFFFENYGLGEIDVHLHADNCSGQNKNNVMLQYLLWRVLSGRHQSVTLSFLITGHTKFSPDGSFGLIKRRFRKTEVNCLATLQDVVTSSSNVNLSQLCGNENGDVFVTSHKWDDFLSAFFKKFEETRSSNISASCQMGQFGSNTLWTQRSHFILF